jgi:hypothetical protein
LARIASAPASALKAAAQAQAQLIIADSAASEAQIVRTSSMRQQQVAGYFAGRRQALTSFFTSSIAGIRSVVADKQAQITAAADGVLKSVSAVVTGAVVAAEAAGERIRATINDIAQSITASVQSSVETATGRIIGLIDSVPLPEAVRAPAVSLLREAANSVSGALSQVVEIIHAAVDTGVSLLGSIMSAIGQVVTEVLEQAVSTVETILSTVLETLAQGVAQVVTTLQSVLLGAIVPVLSRVEAMIVQALTGGEQRVLAQVRENREQHLEALAEALAPSRAGDSGAAATTLADSLAAIRGIGVEAVRINQDLVRTFEAATSFSLTSIIQAVVGAVGYIIQIISARVAAAAQAVASTVAQVLQGLREIAEAVVQFVRTLIQWLATELTNLVSYVRSLMQSPADALVRFAANAWSRLKSFVSSLVSAVFGAVSTIIGIFSPGVAPASGGPITKPGPGPILVIIKTIFTAIVKYVVVGIAIVYYWLEALVGKEAAAVIIVIVLPLLILALILTLLYLLLKWLFKPVPAPPKPKPCTITTRTLVSAPDRTTNKRKTVGVNEEVELTTSSVVTWSSSHGIVVPVTGSTTVWTAPESPGTCTVTATPASGGPCAVMFEVRFPSRISMKKMKEDVIPPGVSGAGMLARVSFLPMSVSFSTTEWLEVPGPASGITGYFVAHTGKPYMYHHPNPHFVRIKKDNTFDFDHAAASGWPAPWSAGTFQWVIPNRLKRAGGGSPGQLALDTVQHFEIAADGTFIVRKQGATVKRSP